MTEREHDDRLFGTWLDDPFAPPPPAYVDDLLETTRRTRQRPAWTSPGRWLPMSITLPGPAPILARPIRALAIGLALLLALLAALTLVPVGASLLRLPATVTGVHGNGLIAYPEGETGDIVVVDPRDGASRTLVEGRPGVGALAWSPDGRRIAFITWVDTGVDDPVVALTVADADGRDLWTLPGIDWTTSFAWSPDATRIALIQMPDASPTLTILSAADGSVLAAPQVPATTISGFAWRPDGGAVVLAGEGATGSVLSTVDIRDGSSTHAILAAPAGDPISVAYSPDGTTIAYTAAGLTHLVDADGTHERVVEIEQADPRPPAYAFQWSASWSPDGSRLLLLSSFHALCPALDIVTVDGSRPTLSVGPVIQWSDIVWFGGAAWSPDGRSILMLCKKEGAPGVSTRWEPWLVDPSTGASTLTGWPVGRDFTWQPVAP